MTGWKKNGGGKTEKQTHTQKQTHSIIIKIRRGPENQTDGEKKQDTGSENVKETQERNRNT